jgi:nucleotide-binding universal stress UspA family protein
VYLLTDHKLRRLVAGVDGSANSELALSWAIDIASAFGAEVIAVHAIGLLTRLGDGPARPSEQHLDELRRVFETDWCRPLDEVPIPSQRMLIHGDPVDVLIRAARGSKADLIVVGRRGAGGFPDRLLGSTSQQLAEHANGPVLVVPADSPD